MGLGMYKMYNYTKSMLIIIIYMMSMCVHVYAIVPHWEKKRNIIYENVQF